MRFHRLGGSADRLDDLRIGCAAAEIPGEVVPNFVLARIGVLRQELVGHQHKARCAEPTLESAVVDEGLLDGQQPAPFVQAFDRGDGFTIGGDG